jgi:DNA-binding MarR family transcriptional regulator
LNKTYKVLLEECSRLPEGDAATYHLFLKLLQSFNDLLAVDELILSSLGTRHRRLVLLMLLDKHAHREMTPTDLAEATGVPPVAISALLDSLEKDGLVSRRPDPVDRCMIRLALTPAGNELLQRVSPTYFEWFTRSVAPVTEDERMQLVRILQKLRHRLMELGARSAPNGAH